MLDFIPSLILHRKKQNSITDKYILKTLAQVFLDSQNYWELILHDSLQVIVTHSPVTHGKPTAYTCKHYIGTEKVHLLLQHVY